MSSTEQWSKLKIPSHRVWSVKEDEETGGYEVVVDIEKLIRSQIQQTRKETIEEIREKIKIYFHKMYKNAHSINGEVKLSAHDINFYGNELLDSLSQEK